MDLASWNAPGLWRCGTPPGAPPDCGGHVFLPGVPQNHGGMDLTTCVPQDCGGMGPSTLAGVEYLGQRSIFLEFLKL